MSFSLGIWKNSVLVHANLRILAIPTPLVPRRDEKDGVNLPSSRDICNEWEHAICLKPQFLISNDQHRSVFR